MAKTKKQNEGNSEKIQPLIKYSDFSTFAELFAAFKDTLETKGDEEIDESHLIFDGKLEVQSSLLSGREDKTFSYEIRLSPLYDHGKVIVKLTNTTPRDIIASLENNNEYKNRLLASISHELRTPLNANISFIQAAIQEPSVSETAKETLLEPALQSGRLLLYLINDILDYSLIQSRELQLNYEVKPLRDTLTNALRLVEKSITAKGLTLKVILDDDLPKQFRTDHGRTTQILLNLLKNASKFTFKGHIILKAKVVSPILVRISVEDTGIGLKESEIPNLFLEKIHSGSGSNSNELSDPNSRSRGIGLGLKISNSLAKKLGPLLKTAIEVESKEEKGSIFSFYLRNKEAEPETIIGRSERKKYHSQKLHSPFRDATIIDDFSSLPGIESLSETDKKQKRIKNFFNNENLAMHFLTQPPNSKDESPSSKHSYHIEIVEAPTISNWILIVDDDPFNILALKVHLQKFNFLTDEAYNGQEAVEKVRAKCGQNTAMPLNGYKMIFMDCQMPVMDGYEASKLLTKMMQNEEIPRIPIIGCTAFTSKNKLDECILCGMDYVITKPVLREKLCELLTKYIN